MQTGMAMEGGSGKLSQRERFGLFGGIICVLGIVVAMVIALVLVMSVQTKKCEDGASNSPEVSQPSMDSKFLTSSDKAANFYAASVSLKGELTFADAPKDVCVYYKLPTLLLVAGKHQQAHAVIDYVKHTFLLPSGDVRTSADKKTDSGALNLYYGYINGWLAMASQRLGRFDVAQPMYGYMKLFWHPTLGGYTTGAPYNASGENQVDILTVSHFGLADLYFGDLEKAKTAGALCQKFIESQPNASEEFYLRMDDSGKLITTAYPADLTPFYVVKIKEPNQLYFMVGYPVAFLAKLYQATGKEEYLNSSRAILDFILTSHESIYSFNFAHKAAWAAVIVARITKEEKYASFSRKVADFLVTQQDETGVYMADAPPIDKYDQSAELGIWLREIQTELNLMGK